MQHNGHVVLAALQPVGRVDRDAFADGSSSARIAVAWSRCAIRSAVTGAPPGARSEYAIAPRPNSRSAICAQTDAASVSVRTVCRAGISYNAHPVAAAISMAWSIEA
jgi:hypothetical protein